jgi:Coenzyme PQQ synthesis protein D (PqqD)
MVLRSEFTINTSSVVFERLNGEVIIISNQNGKYYSLGYTASDIWYLIQTSVSSSLWLKTLADNYQEIPDSAEDEVKKFLDDLLSENLINSSKAAFGELQLLPEDNHRGKWSCPELLIFDDLQDLLLVDPIHDTGEEGWPFASRE